MKKLFLTLALTTLLGTCATTIQASDTGIRIEGNSNGWMGIGCRFSSNWGVGFLGTYYTSSDHSTTPATTINDVIDLVGYVEYRRPLSAPLSFITRIGLRSTMGLDEGVNVALNNTVQISFSAGLEYPLNDNFSLISLWRLSLSNYRPYDYSDTYTTFDFGALYRF